MSKKVYFIGNGILAEKCYNFAQKSLQIYGDFAIQRVDRAVPEIKTADAVLFVKNTFDDIIRSLRLYAEMSFFDNYIVIREAGEKNFSSMIRRGELGREMAETIAFSELEMEKTARIAFEYTEKRGCGLYSVDNAGYTPIGLFWRKVVSEVASDYPFVPVTDVTAPVFIGTMVNESKTSKIFLTNRVTGGMICDVITKLVGEKLRYVSLLGETTSAAYGIGEEGSVDDFKQAIKMMFSESFDMEISPEIFMEE